MEVRPLSRDVLRVVERALPALAAALAVLFLFAASAGCADELTSDVPTRPNDRHSQLARTAAGLPGLNQSTYFFFDVIRVTDD
jgi:hypothetical protein